MTTKDAVATAEQVEAIREITALARQLHIPDTCRVPSCSLCRSITTLTDFTAAWPDGVSE